MKTLLIPQVHAFKLLTYLSRDITLMWSSFCAAAILWDPRSLHPSF